MSHPWYLFRVTFVDGYEEDFQATDMTPTWAMGELLKDTMFESNPLSPFIEQHGEVTSIRWVGMAEGYEDLLPEDVRVKLVTVEEVQRDH